VPDIATRNPSVSKLLAWLKKSTGDEIGSVTCGNGTTISCNRPWRRVVTD